MDLDQQLSILIDNAPQDGRTPQAMQAIAPALKLLASQLRYLQYYILQTLDESWVVTTLSNRAGLGQTKRVVYAFPTLQDISAQVDALLDPQVMAIPVPVTHILFQMVAMNTIDSTVFFEAPGNLSEGTELRRDDLQTLIQSQLQQHLFRPKSENTNLPPDIA